jgi:putative MATE family efflux protein
VVLVAFQSAVSIADSYFVGRLGTAPLAGLALVFPLVMLLQMTTAGAMGGGVSSAIARALGAGQPSAARRFVVHALLIAGGIGLLFTVLLVPLGRMAYALLGGRDHALANALAYSDVLFGGAIVVSLANILANILRGTGNMLVPAGALIAAALVQIPLCGLLVREFGIQGAALAYIASFGIAGCALAFVVFRPSSALRPRAADFRLEWRLFRDILRVGALSSLNAVQTVFTALVLTGLVGRYGAAALAGYGVGLRLELLQIPLVFAIGQSLVVLVGVHIGAGQAQRAKRIAWTGAAMGACISLVIGVTVTLAPLAWVGLFSSDPAVLESGSLYLRTVAPFYAFLAIGIALYFSSQGAGKVLWPFLAGTARLAIVVGGGALVASLQGIFAVIAFAVLAFGVLTALFTARVKWN